VGGPLHWAPEGGFPGLQAKWSVFVCKHRLDQGILARGSEIAKRHQARPVCFTEFNYCFGNVFLVYLHAPYLPAGNDGLIYTLLRLTLTLFAMAVISSTTTFLIRFYLVRMRDYYLIYDISILFCRESINILESQNRLSRI
jgi:hypothetical protein